MWKPEIVRDIALAASGLLNPRIGGPSVFPPAPEFLFKPPASYGPKIWDSAEGEDRYRRALYTFRYRSVPYPMLQTFDAPNGDSACVRRSRSNTPLQALTALNEPLFIEAAQALALKTLREGGESDLERVTFAFRRSPGQEARTGRESRTTVAAAQTDRSSGGRLDQSLGNCRDWREAKTGTPGRSHSCPTGGMDDGFPCPAESGRDHHQGMRNCEWSGRVAQISVALPGL